MPASASNTYTYLKLTPSIRPDLSRIDPFQMTPSLTFTRGQALARATSTGYLVAYVDGGSDGAGTFLGLCEEAAVSDSAGNITLQGGSALGRTQDTVGVYTGGYFLSADVTGLDANGLADVGGHMVWGDLTTGEFVIPV